MTERFDLSPEDAQTNPGDALRGLIAKAVAAGIVDETTADRMTADVDGAFMTGEFLRQYPYTEGMMAPRVIDRLWTQGFKVVADAAGSGGASHVYTITVPIGTMPIHKEGAAVPVDGAPDTRTTIDIVLPFQFGPAIEGVNGLTNEVVLACVADRLEGFQGGEFACPENAFALGGIRFALECLHRRTTKRRARGVEWTHTP